MPMPCRCANSRMPSDTRYERNNETKYPVPHNLWLETSTKPSKKYPIPRGIEREHNNPRENALTVGNQKASCSMTVSLLAAYPHTRISAQLRDPMPYRQSNMCELGHTNEALHHFLSPEVSLTHPGAQEHINYLGADGSLVLAVGDWISARMMSRA